MGWDVCKMGVGEMGGGRDGVCVRWLIDWLID